MLKSIKRNILFIKNNFVSNFFAGFVVSLVALPLSLGLATASGLAPVAGLITAIIGGSIVAIFGGSYLTITGPGNSLVPIVLAAIATLGAGNELLGQTLLFAAVIVSGVLIFIFGVFRLGKLSSFFPSSAIQGLLTAIGIIILAKQLHVMFGNIDPIKGNTLSILAQVPQTIMKIKFASAGFYAALIGCASLLIMFFHGKIKNRYLHAIPAPMMVLILAVTVGYFFEYLSTDSPFFYHRNYLIQVPNNIISEYRFPDLLSTLDKPEVFFSWKFISVVLSLTLIAGIESLLSISAVEKLDPMRRKSNVNLDLKALGGASVLAGFAGGMNVVTVIARSSVAAQNNATSRLANFFHAFLLMLFLLFLSPMLNKVALSSLAAILVYTGYKLALPKIFVDKLKSGLDQFVIFFLTIIITLTVGLIQGIVLGMLITLVFHLLMAPNRALMFKSLLMPNTLMYQQEDGEYYISVKGFSNFLNFHLLKNKLDSIPTTSHVILDFSLTSFVDLTVREHLQQYMEIFLRAGGNIELIGTEGKKKNIILFKEKSQEEERKLSKKQEALRDLSEKIAYQFVPRSFQNFQSLYWLKFFCSKQIKIVKNIIRSKDKQINCFEVHYSAGEFILKEHYQATFLTLNLKKTIPNFTLDRELLFDRLNEFSELFDIKTNNKAFNKKFLLKGKKKKSIVELFDEEVTDFLLKNTPYHLESNGSQILILQYERLLSPTQIESMISFAEQLSRIINIKPEV